MARFNFSAINFIILFGILTTGFYGNYVNVNGQCQGDLRGLITQCVAYVQRTGPRMNPSLGCCGMVRTLDVSCMCNHISREVEQLISMEKAVYVAQYCGNALPRGSYCGSYTVPSV